MTDLQGLRSIKPLLPASLQGLVPGEISGDLPQFELVDPRDIFVEDSYQRQLGENGVRLIRRIYAGFDWKKFKAPVCVRIPEWDNVLVCIDGQHTATAAATHPGITKIPVMIVSAADAQSRARAFVGHNRDRLGLTQMALYYAELAADDPVAIKVDQACKMAGAEVLRKAVNLKNKLEPGKTIAVGTLKAIASSKGTNFLGRVLKVLVMAGRGPVKADEIAAVTLVLESARLDDPGERLAKVVGSRTAEAWAASVAVELAEKGGSLPFALARVWSKEIGLSLAAGLASPRGKGSGIGTTARMMARRRPEAPKVPAAPKTAPTASPEPPAPPLPKPKPPAAPAKPPEPPTPITIEGSGSKSATVIRFNGIEIDRMTRELRHAGAAVRLPDDGIRLVASLARVMPALMEEARVARTSFGSINPESRNRLRLLVDEIAPSLAQAGLEVKFVPKEFICLRELRA